MVPIHFTTTTNAVAVTPIPNYTELWGFSATDSKDATYYLKIWFQGNTNTVPIAGTTKPTVTFAIQSGAPNCVYMSPVILQGPMYYAVTLNAADRDTTY